MAALQIDIMKIKQLLLLKSRNKSNREIALSIGIDRNTVNTYVQKIKSGGHTYAELLTKDEHELQSLFPSKEVLEKERYIELVNLFPGFVNELKKPGCTRQHLWVQYNKEHIDYYSYSQFCLHFRKWLNKKKISGKLNHVAGEKLYIDYAGKKLQIVDKHTGEITDVEVFVGILPASQYTYVEASLSQKREQLVESVSNCLEYFGGVPQSIVPDNLKSAVTKSSKYEPVVNKTFRDMGNHYKTVINPTRSYSPQDKALVESAVKLVYQRIYYPMSNMVFHSLADLNKQIWVLLEQYNDYKLQVAGISRLKQFTDLEKEYLNPLPQQAYSMKNYSRAKVQKMGYVYLNEQKNYYSVPYRFISKQVEIQHNTNTVEIYFNKERIALHAKSYKRGEYVTIKSHLSSSHQFVQEWSKDFFVNKALVIGQNTSNYIAKLIDTQTYPEIGYKRSMGILSLKNKYTKERIERACLKAISYDQCSYSIIQNILKNNIDLEPDIKLIKHEVKQHNNLREISNYK